MADVSDSREHPVLGSAELEMKKRRLLVELESALSGEKTVTAQASSSSSSSLGLGIEVIDETALLDSVAKKKGGGGGSKKNHQKSQPSNKIGNKKYSRKELEGLRFVNMAQQRKFWKAIHAAFQSTVAMEYDTLASTPLPPHNKPILSAVWDSEKGTPVDHSCSHNLVSEDGCSIAKQCSEEDDGSDDDYASIQRPAFMVDGEPNLDSGPPEDGWEYLRRVRWEAHHIPKVKVAKLDRGKLNKEQSAYMPQIPDIAKCPEHLLPLKEWEDVFLAEFSALRRNFSCLDGSTAIHSENLHVHSSQLVGNNCGEFSSAMSRDVLLNNHLRIGKTNDQPTNSTAKDNDRTLSPENPEAKSSADQTSSSSSPTLPLLSVILAMDSVARVSSLLRRIRLLEAADTMTRNDCMWLFALCATVDTPLDADTCAALRSLLRKCASIRAGKAGLDEEVVMLNILATISGRYFGQSEN